MFLLLNWHHKSMRPELVYLCQPLATVVMGSYEPFKDMSWGVLAGSDTELSEMSPQTDPVSHESLHDCIQTLCVFFSSDIHLTKFFDIVIPILGTPDVVVYKL